MKQNQTDFCPTNQTLEAAKKEMELKQVPTFSYYMSNVIPGFDRIAGDSYDALSDISKKCIDNAIVRYIEWLNVQNQQRQTINERLCGKGQNIA